RGRDRTGARRRVVSGARSSRMVSIGDLTSMPTPAFSSNHGATGAAERRVTILGATCSIRARTIGPHRRDRASSRLAAVMAHKNAGALATLAREPNARFAAVGDPAAYGELKEALAGSSIEAGAGESALVEAAARPAQWVIGAITGAAGLKPTLAAAER